MKHKRRNNAKLVAAEVFLIINNNINMNNNDNDDNNKNNSNNNNRSFNQMNVLKCTLQVQRVCNQES